MSDTFKRVLELVRNRQVKVSEHGYDELADEGILAREVVEGVALAVVVEDYPDYPKGPCVLVLQKDSGGMPLHAVWGIPRGEAGPAVLVTAYRPHPDRWDESLMQRKK
jgi:Domain of unknown function (DUF4258)